MWSTRETLVGDVGLTTVGPVKFGMMDLATVARHGAPRKRTTAVLGVEHDALSRRGKPLTSGEIERLVGVLVEDRQVVM